MWSTLSNSRRISAAAADITDTGVGIDEENLAKLFAPLLRTSSPANQKLGAKGLGLSISRRLVELMGGRIWAESSVGIGSSFHLALPFIVARRTAASDTVEERDAISAQWEGPALQILLAEDNAINQKFAVTILEHGTPGHQHQQRKEAVQLWKQGAFDLILMDIQMPLLRKGCNSCHQKSGRRHRPAYTDHCADRPCPAGRKAATARLRI